MSNTPKFKVLLDEYYTKEKPGERICAETGTKFVVSQREFDLYKSLDMPLPMVAPWVRFRRLRSFMAGFDLFKRQTDSGELLISMYDPESPAKLWPNKEWFSDKFVATDYARDCDTSRSFFDQYKEFSWNIPRPAINQDPNSENSAWALYDLQSRDCYFVYGGLNSQGLNYSDFCADAKYSTDCTALVNSEWCYEAVQCTDSSHIFYSERCEACLEMYFSYQCESCSYCFGCTNLVHKKYCWFNEQLTEGEYKKRLAAVDFKDSRVVHEWEKKAHEFWEKAYHLAGQCYTSEDVVGDQLGSSRDVFGGYAYNAQHSYNVFDVSHLRDCLDVTTSSGSERLVNCVSIVPSYDLKMCLSCSNCLDVEYSEFCYSSEHCFGCVGLRHKKFHIFNKEYSEEEYWRKVDEIKCTMLKSGVYGNFFPYSLSFFAYNTTHANVLYPLNEGEIKKLGMCYYDFAVEKNEGGADVSEISEKLDEVRDNIIQKVFKSRINGRAFRIAKPELDFHRQMGLALPHEHPIVRRTRRSDAFRSFSLYPNVCSNCQKRIWSRLQPGRQLKLVCEDCYRKLVYAGSEAV